MMTALDFRSSAGEASAASSKGTVSLQERRERHPARPVPRTCSLVAIICLTAFVAFTSTGHSAAAAPDDADAILREAASAVAGPREGTLQVRYAYTIAGMTGTRTSVSDLASGAFVDADAVGPFERAFGYDGSIPWMRDLSGANTPQQGGDRVQTSVNEAYRRANLWAREDRGGASVKYVGRETEDGVILQHLIIVPPGGKPFDAWFDATTHLLTRIAEEWQFFHARMFYSDYRRENGVLLPHRVTIDPGVGKEHYETLVLEEVRLEHTPRPLAWYTCPKVEPTGMGIVDGKASTVVPFRFLNNHVYVSASVNGKGPYTFIVDTGGHTVLSPKLISEAGLNSFGKAATSGVGEKVETSGFAIVHEIAVGDVRMHDQPVIVLPVYDRSIEGIAVDGMVGFELFRRFAVRMDYGAKQLTITRFDAFAPPAGETAVPFVFYDHLPSVRGLVDDLPARFDIDTGSRMEVDLTTPFVERANLRERYGNGVSMITGWGAGGESRSSVVRIPSLTLGSVRIDNIVAGLSEAKSGSISDANYEGNIGSGLLRRFVVTFDYSRQVMYLKPLSPPPPDAGQFDRSGMWINAENGGYLVRSVAAGSPAASAGLAEGDVIVTLDGEPASPEHLSDARTLLRARPAGSKVPVKFRRGDADHTTVLTLRDQV
ncbi:hypothetical protein DB347_24725 [Opitutaceae bacterium EW11]|nr:hypothetical protein DB347_24725 [Opitutaceae bacterium EW11]